MKVYVVNGKSESGDEYVVGVFRNVPSDEDINKKLIELDTEEISKEDYDEEMSEGEEDCENRYGICSWDIYRHFEFDGVYYRTYIYTEIKEVEVIEN